MATERFEKKQLLLYKFNRSISFVDKDDLFYDLLLQPDVKGLTLWYTYSCLKIYKESQKLYVSAAKLLEYYTSNIKMHNVN